MTGLFIHLRRNRKFLGVSLVMLLLAPVSANLLGPEAKLELLANTVCLLLVCLPVLDAVRKKAVYRLRAFSCAGIAATIFIFGKHLYDTRVLLRSAPWLEGCQAWAAPLLVLGSCGLYAGILHILAYASKKVSKSRMEARRALEAEAQTHQNTKEQAGPVAADAPQAGAVRSGHMVDRPRRAGGNRPQQQRASEVKKGVFAILFGMATLAVVAGCTLLALHFGPWEQLETISFQNTFDRLYNTMGTVILLLGGGGFLVMLAADILHMLWQKIKTQPEERDGSAVRRALNNRSVLIYLSFGIFFLLDRMMTAEGVDLFSMDAFYDSMLVNNEFMAVGLNLLFRLAFVALCIKLIYSILAQVFIREKSSTWVAMAELGHMVVDFFISTMKEVLQLLTLLPSIISALLSILSIGDIDERAQDVDDAAQAAELQVAELVSEETFEEAN